jgi:hypothetical protein
MIDPEIPLEEFLLDASEQSLIDFELARLGDSSRYAKEGQRLLRRSSDSLGQALFARWVRTNRKMLLELGRTNGLQKLRDFPCVPAVDARPAAGPQNSEAVHGQQGAKLLVG